MATTSRRVIKERKNQTEERENRQYQVLEKEGWPPHGHEERDQEEKKGTGTCFIRCRDPTLKGEEKEEEEIRLRMLPREKKKKRP